jgi:hypothetical protein
LTYLDSSSPTSGPPFGAFTLISNKNGEKLAFIRDL